MRKKDWGIIDQPCKYENCSWCSCPYTCEYKIRIFSYYPNGYCGPENGGDAKKIWGYVCELQI